MSHPMPIIGTVLIALLVLPSCSNGSTPTGRDRIVYQAPTGFETVMEVDADGNGQFAPTAGAPEGDQTNPDWSPDGKHVVFALATGGTEPLWTVNADGTDLRELAACTEPCASLDDPAWSPDGTVVLYARNTDEAGSHVATLETVGVADGRVTVLLTAGTNEFFAGPRFSPDRRSIVFEDVHSDGPSMDATVMGVTLTVADLSSPATTRRGLTDPSLFAATADWGPNGERIIYSAKPDAAADRSDLFSIRADGTDLRRVTHLVDVGGSAEHPAWSPDRSTIYFLGTIPGTGSGLYRTTIAGESPTPLVPTGRFPGQHPRVHRAP